MATLCACSMRAAATSGQISISSITFRTASIRHPTLLTRLGLPTVIGPLGGGEAAPMAAPQDFSLEDWCMELVRDVYNWALRVDPITRLAFRDAKLIFLRTEQSLVAVPPVIGTKFTLMSVWVLLRL